MIAFATPLVFNCLVLLSDKPSDKKRSDFWNTSLEFMSPKLVRFESGMAETIEKTLLLVGPIVLYYNHKDIEREW